VARYPQLIDFLRQDLRHPSSWRDSSERLHATVCR
jgi:hypothetical protein